MKIPLIRRKIVGFSAANREKIKIAFFDADSTLRVAPSGSRSARNQYDVALLPLLFGPMKKLSDDGFLIAIVSNQGGVNCGHITVETAELALATTVLKLAEQGISIHYFDFAENYDENRKPGIGMANRLAAVIKREFDQEVDWGSTIVIGDSGWKKGVDNEPDGRNGEDVSNSDRLFAENLAKTYGGVKFFHPRDFFGWVNYGIRNFASFKDLEEFFKRYPELMPNSLSIP